MVGEGSALNHEGQLDWQYGTDINVYCASISTWLGMKPEGGETSNDHPF